MSLAIYDLKSKCHGDRMTLVADGTLSVYPEDLAPVPAFQYNPVTASFETWASGTKYALLTNSTINKLTTIDDVSAEMETVELLSSENIMERTTIDSVYIKTGIANKSINIKKFTDFFTQENTTIYDSLNLYNDPSEINSGVTTSIFGGSRSNIVHADIPIGSGDIKGLSLKIEATNEANIHALKIIALDNNIGGDR